MFFWEMSQSQSSHVAPAVVGSFASLGGAAWGAFHNLTAQVSTLPDNIPVVGGIAIGIIGLGWSIFSAGPDRRVKTLAGEIETLREQLDSKDDTIREQDAAIKSCLIERNKLLAEIGRLEGLLAKYQAQAIDNARPAISAAPPPPAAPTPG